MGTFSTTGKKDFKGEHSLKPDPTPSPPISETGCQQTSKV